MCARILAVDDNEQVLRALQRILKSHQVQTCSGGREALDVLEAHEFDLIICDVMMPDLTGVDVFDALQSQGRGLERRIIFITGGVPGGHLQRFLERTKNQILLKPFTPEELEAVVERQISVDPSGDEP